MEQNQKIAIGYCRKSTNLANKTIEESMDYQIQAIKQYTEKNNIELIKFYSDLGFSGKNTNRPEFQQMLLFLKSTKQPVNEVVMYSIDRFGRDLKNNIETLLEILLYVERIYFVSENNYTDSEIFKMLFSLLTGAAQYERERLLKRLSDGRKAKVINRKSFVGNFPALGLIKEKNTEKLVPATKLNSNDLKSNIDYIIVQFIFYLYLFNTPLREIAKVINKIFGKTKRGAEWNYKSVQYVLSNPVYCGSIRGVLNKKEHYYLENANIQMMVDPLIFSLVETKIHFENRGRKKTVLYRDPYFTCCHGCAEALIEDKDNLVCPTCKKKINKMDISEEIERKLGQFLIDNMSIIEVDYYRDQFLLKEKNKLIEVERQLHKLREHKKYIEDFRY